MKRFSLLSAVLIALASRALAATCSPTTFIQPASFPSGLSPQAVTVGDFTNDGKLDIVAGLSQSTVSVLPGDGASGFGPPISSPGIYQPGYMATGHFDPDANLDVAIVSFYGGLVVLLGNGDGTFQPPVSYDTQYGPTGLVIGDFNGDDVLDIATTSDNGNELVILIGNGDGSFQPPVFTQETDIIRSLAIGDFDGDGNPDLVAPGSGNVVRIYPGLGDGTFGVPTELEIGFGLQGSTVGHFGGSGLDFAVTTDSYVAVVRGNGDGTFQAAVDYPLNTFAYSLLAADLDGDGRDDLAALSLGSNSAIVSVLSQQADGTMGTTHGYEVGRVNPAFAAGDFEGDGRARLAFAAVEDDRVSVVLSTTGPHPLLAPQTVIVARSPRTILATDFNGDVLADLAVLGDQITILTAGSDGFFRVLSTTPVDGGVSMAAGDFNGDAKVDLAVTSYSQLYILMGNGDGTFQPPVAYSGPFGQQWITVNDFTGDGILDIGLTDASNGNFGEVTVFVGVGDGTFVQGPSTPLTHYPNSLLSNALDGNNPIDLVTTNGSSNSISVLKGNGDGSFQAPLDYATGPNPVWAEVGNFNGDGALDLVVANSGESNVSVLINDGNGGFGTMHLIGVGWTPTAVTAADLNGDGADDIVTVNGPSYNVSVLLATGNGGFQTPQTYAVSGVPTALVATNLDGGALDLAVATQGDSGRVSIFENARLDAVAYALPPLIVGSTAHLAVHADGYGELTYQWKKNGIPLSDGGPISGSSTSTLTIDPVSFLDATAAYDFVISDWCTSLEATFPGFSVEFDDVPVTNPFHNDIITIATSGIAAGCTNTSYCPSNPVSRAEMAVFLLKSKFGADHVPPPPPPVPIFPDVPADAFAAAWIDELATLSITGGCGDGNGDYCPNDPVTRGQMAVFLLKTLLGSGYTPPPPAGIFGDVPADYFSIAWIEDIYNRGITAGCGTNPLRFCPDQNVPREQMATLLVRTFGL